MSVRAAWSEGAASEGSGVAFERWQSSSGGRGSRPALAACPSWRQLRRQAWSRAWVMALACLLAGARGLGGAVRQSLC